MGGVLALDMARTADQMIVHHPHGLHKGVTDGAADEVEAELLERLDMASDSFDVAGISPLP